MKDRWLHLFGEATEAIVYVIVIFVKFSVIDSVGRSPPLDEVTPPVFEFELATALDGLLCVAPNDQRYVPAARADVEKLPS